MRALYDEDGIDGPFNREMGRLMKKDAKPKRARKPKRTDRDRIREAQAAHEATCSACKAADASLSEWYARRCAGSDEMPPHDECALRMGLVRAWCVALDAEEVVVLFDGIRAACGGAS